MTTPRSKPTAPPAAYVRPVAKRYEDMTPAEIDAIYMRLAQAVRRFDAREAARATAPATDTTPTGGHE